MSSSCQLMVAPTAHLKEACPLQGSARPSRRERRSSWPSSSSSYSSLLAISSWAFWVLTSSHSDALRFLLMWKSPSIFCGPRVVLGIRGLLLKDASSILEPPRVRRMWSMKRLFGLTWPSTSAPKFPKSRVFIRTKEKTTQTYALFSTSKCRFKKSHM
jgi:hypothetical protein